MSKLISKFRISTLLILILAVTLGNQAFAQATPNYAYFLDVLSDSNVSNTPAGYAVIGEASSTQRASWTDNGRIVGMSVALNSSLWSTISSNFSSSTPVVNKQLLAQNIINSALQYPGEFPLSSERTPTTSNGYVIWAQDFEFESSSSTDELYAGVTAVLWAGRQLLGTDFKIIPVPASYLFKTLGGYNSSNIVNGVGSTPYLASLGLSAPPKSNPQASSGGEWNFLSLLHANDLIDGFLGQQYAENNQEALPGSVSSDTLHFYQDIPYAILSAHDNPSQLTDTTIGGPPWQSHYDGDMPFQAGVYWHTDVDSSFNPSSVLTPTEQSLTSLAIPEPSAFSLFAIGLGGLAMLRRRRS
ncbi:MAG: PEP-CTERM sorting domain-containing protein [Betaproteobacteria bacterium]|nr:PEP-CTERM sorting domain-containing protein [Betaproteobacteria bacterium]